MPDPTPVDATSSRSDLEELEALEKKIATSSSQIGEDVFYTILTLKVNKNDTMQQNIDKLRLELEKLTSLEAHILLVKSTTRLLFEDKTFQITPTRQSAKGAVPVVVDALTRRLWVCEEELANSLRFDSQLLSQILKFLEEKHFVRSSTKEFAVLMEERQHGSRNKRFKKTKKYCSLAYEKIPKVIKYLNLKVEEKLDNNLKHATSDTRLYLCQTCNKEYTSLEALSLVRKKSMDGFFCERCGSVLVDLSIQLEHEAIMTIQKKEDQFEPISILLKKVENLPVLNLGIEPELLDGNSED